MKIAILLTLILLCIPKGPEPYCNFISEEQHDIVVMRIAHHGVEWTDEWEDEKESWYRFKRGKDWVRL